MLLLLILFYSSHLAISLGCLSSMDCSLLGECLNSKCVCDMGFRGDTCGILDLVPGRTDYGYHNVSEGVGASWGGNSIFFNGEWHAFIAEMTQNCTLNEWGSNSAIIHVVSTKSALGPFRKVGMVFPPFAHNPTVRALPDGTGFVIYMISGQTTQQNCSKDYAKANNSNNLKQPNSNIKVAFSTDLYTWSEPMPVEFTNWNDSILCGFTNPSVSFFANGSLLMAFTAGLCKPVTGVEETIGVAYADSWKSPHQLLKPNPIHNYSKICVAGFAEDPFIWKSIRGFHIIMHGMCYAPFNSKLAYSVDGKDWIVNEFVEPYSYIVNYVDRSESQVFWRVERPQIVFGKMDANYSLANPIGLFNGVCDNGIECLDVSNKVKLKTWTLARPFKGN